MNTRASKGPKKGKRGKGKGRRDDLDDDGDALDPMVHLKGGAKRGEAQEGEADPDDEEEQCRREMEVRPRGIRSLPSYCVIFKCRAIIETLEIYLCLSSFAFAWLRVRRSTLRVSVLFQPRGMNVLATKHRGPLMECSVSSGSSDKPCKR